jgi:thymidylate kinase
MIIGLEGVSCVGKTTLAKALSARLPASNVACYYNAAPTCPGHIGRGHQGAGLVNGRGRAYR